MSYNSLKIVPIDDVLFVLLVEFFGDIKDNEFFHPHSFEKDYIDELCEKSSKDLFYCLTSSNKVIAYGILRGWDDGWDDICVGVIVRESERNNGYGELMMKFLCSVARLRSVKRLRLHVNPNNAAAFSLYEKLGYRFNGEMFNNERVGYYDIRNS